MFISYILLPVTRNISSRFSSNCEVFASELQENLEEMILQYNIHNDKFFYWQWWIMDMYIIITSVITIWLEVIVITLSIVLQHCLITAHVFLFLYHDCIVGQWSSHLAKKHLAILYMWCSTIVYVPMLNALYLSISHHSNAIAL